MDRKQALSKLASIFLFKEFLLTQSRRGAKVLFNFKILRVLASLRPGVKLLFL
jgi:hypothetical protein